VIDWLAGLSVKLQRKCNKNNNDYSTSSHSQVTLSVDMAMLQNELRHGRVPDCDVSKFLAVVRKNMKKLDMVFNIAFI